jgi:hypothetical protein
MDLFGWYFDIRAFVLGYLTGLAIGFAIASWVLVSARCVNCCQRRKDV